MNNSPKSWTATPLGDVLTERSEVPSSEGLATGAIRIISKIGFSDGRIQLRSDSNTRTGMILVRPGDLVVSGINAAKGAIAIYGEENTEPVAATIHYGAYIPNKGHVDVRFLWWLLRSQLFRDILDANLPGGIKTELKAKRVLPIEVPLPPLDEQRRIVSRIEELATKIENACGLRQQAIREVQVLFESGMRASFDFSGAKKCIGDFASILGGYAFPSEGYVEAGSHQVIRIGNVRNGYLDLSRAPVRWAFQGEERLRKYELREGDILISMTGTRNKRDYGYVAIVPPATKLLLNQRVGKVVVHTRMDNHYLAYFLRSPFFRDNLFPKATGTANQANIGNASIEEIPFEPPENVEEQRRIVTYLDNLQEQVNTLKKLQSETAEELDALMPSVLDKAFRGEL